MAQVALSQRFTPTTTALMRWWFDREGFGANSSLRFQEAQRRSILRTISAHESLDAEVPWIRRGGGVRRVALAGDTDQVAVLLALLVWQVLNRNDARAAGLHDPRFTHRFVAVVPDLIARGRLYNALCGLPRPGAPGHRDFDTADIVRRSDLLLPAHRRDEVLDFVRAHVCSGMRAVHKPLGDGVIAITGDRAEALECVARLPEAMVFEDETCMNDLFFAQRRRRQDERAEWF
jgi:hypothetical protein